MIHSILTTPSKTSAVICIEMISYVLTLIQTMNERDFLKHLILLPIVKKETYILNNFLKFNSKLNLKKINNNLLGN